MNIFLNEYFGFCFELNHFSARFNEKWIFKTYRPGLTYSHAGTGYYEAGTADQRKFWQNSLFLNLQGELVALMNGARSPPSLHQEWSDYRYISSFLLFLLTTGVFVLFFSSNCRCCYNLEPITADMTRICCHCTKTTQTFHTWYLSRSPRTCPCKFFLAGVHFYRFNAKKIGNLLCILP